MSGGTLLALLLWMLTLCGLCVLVPSWWGYRQQTGILARRVADLETQIIAGKTATYEVEAKLHTTRAELLTAKAKIVTLERDLAKLRSPVAVANELLTADAKP